MKSRLLIVLGLTVAWASRAVAGAPPPDVTEIDIDDLVRMHVTSPAKKTQSSVDVPSAIYVIRGDDLRRSGATSLPEALRGVPGLAVARTNANTWAITARGFNDNFSNKLLVLIDGRSVYSPLHSGVYWDVQDVLLEDVDRIEVIRGPGGTLWGANAVNGIINVITKRSEDTPGVFASAGGGTEERAAVGVRYGFKASESANVRVYAKFFDRDDAANGLDPDMPAYDGWSMARTGFRADWSKGARDRITLSGDYYGGRVREHVTEPLLTAPFAQTIDNRMIVRGGNVLTRWERTFDPSKSLSVQFYYDTTDRAEALFNEVVRTADLDAQYRFSPRAGHDLVFGLGYRNARSDLDGSFAISVDPQVHSDDLVSAFIQDEIALAGERLHLTLGSKFEHNDSSGFEWQPSARLSYNASALQMAWFSYSRAVRTPSIIDFDGRLTPIVAPTAPPIAFSIFGDHDFQSEVLTAYEAGYRVRPADRLSFDLALFSNRYHRLRSGDVGTPFLETSPGPLHIVIPIFLGNNLYGSTRGAELATNVQAAPWWLFQASYAYLAMDVSEDVINHQSPRHQASVRSATDLPSGLTLDVTGRYVSGLSAYDVDAYTELDARFAWRSPSRSFELAVVGQNLLHGSHPEFQVASQRSEIQRGAYLTLTWRHP